MGKKGGKERSDTLSKAWGNVTDLVALDGLYSSVFVQEGKGGGSND